MERSLDICIIFGRKKSTYILSFYRIRVLPSIYIESYQTNFLFLTIQKIITYDDISSKIKMYLKTADSEQRERNLLDLQ